MLIMAYNVYMTVSSKASEKAAAQTA